MAAAYPWEPHANTPPDEPGVSLMNRLAAYIAVALLTFATSALAQTIGFSQVGSESWWRTSFSADMLREAGLRGIALRFDNAEGSVERQIAAVRRFIRNRVDAIVVAPIVVSGWTPVLKEAHAAGIPVFIADRSVDADRSLYVTRIGNDTNLEGRLAAAWLAQASRGRCNIVELRGTPDSAPAIGRTQGFASVIAQFPDMRIVRSEIGNFSEERGRQIIERLIGSTDSLRGICAVWAQNDEMLLGGITALKAAGLRPGKDILTISVDGVPRIYRAIVDGDANASVEVRPDIGGFIFDVVESYLLGKRDYPKWMVIPGDLHTSEDAGKMLQKVTQPPQPIRNPVPG